ncbi:hypothetical protein VTJ04DRAFT_7711 [Mycothermus thermophilus]|uniref:uncharacterized protein n=1 Tax=Humicola insolens TaxID=85995 RepID=UPI003742014B
MSSPRSYLCAWWERRAVWTAVRRVNGQTASMGSGSQAVGRETSTQCLLRAEWDPKTMQWWCQQRGMVHISSCVPDPESIAGDRGAPRGVGCQNQFKPDNPGRGAGFCNG